MKQITTRVFEFPNGGHSIRKLCDSIYELGNVQIDLVMEPQEDQYDTKTDDHCQLYCVVDHNKGKFNSIKLADKLRTLGTRFQVVNKPFRINGELTTNYELVFHTDFDDIIQYPKFYNVN